MRKYFIDVAEEKIHGKEINLEMLKAEVGNAVLVFGSYSELIDEMAFALVCEAPMCLIRIAVGNVVFSFWQVYSEVLLHRLSFGRINWFSDYMDEYNHDPLVNYDNDNENDDLGYQSEENFDKVQEDDENNHSNRNVVKRCITRLYKFRREYRKPDGIKLSVTFDALNRISGKHRALFLSFLGDMVPEHIGLNILSWKKVDSEARDKLWDEITRYFDVDLTVRKLVMNRLGQLLRNFKRKLRQTYIFPNKNTLSKLNEVLAKYSAILQAEEWVNFVKYTATEEYKVKSTATKMARSKSVVPAYNGTRWISTCERENDEEPARGTLCLKGRVNKDGEYPDDEIRSVGDKLVDHGTDAMIVVLGKEKGGYARGVRSGVTYKSADEEGETKIHGCENEASIQKSNGLATLEKELETRATKCKMWHLKKSTITALGTVYKTDGKQMLHNKELPKDCYKVSIDTSLVDATCIPYVGNDGFKTVKDAVVSDKRGFCFLHATPPSTIHMNVENKTAPKLQTKRKNVYVSSDAMQRKAKKKRSP
nr:hypothetical protein [Tanacetum cinerariifolium]